jgi:flagellum-specific ATP synthase
MSANPVIDRVARAEFVSFEGRVTAIGSGFVEGDGPLAKLGDYCAIGCGEASRPVPAEVIAVERQSVRLMPLSDAASIELGAEIVRIPHASELPVGEDFAGRAVDALARPIDQGTAIHPDRHLPKGGRTLPALDRGTRRERLLTGIRAIDGLLPMAKGQRIGIFAAAGVGKTSLTEQIVLQACCDRKILCLVGERGREVERAWRLIAESTARDSTTLVAATAEASPSLRIRALDQAVALAEYWRGNGEDVLLVVDSITRVAHSLRELGFAAGHPPAIRGLTPNVFAALPAYVERCGADRNGGTITAVLTVLSETDDNDDPIVELMKSVLDGHIVLSRSRAERRLFPAIDISRSVSRLADELVDADAASSLRQLHTAFARYEEARPMIEAGIYREGSDPEIDRAIRLRPSIERFVKQGGSEFAELEETLGRLHAIAGEGGGNG